MLLILSLAPVLIIAFYIYFRDKYEKEPFGLLLMSLLAGGVIIIPVLMVDKLLEYIISFFFTETGPAYTAFVSAGMVEEGFKFLAVFVLVWKNPNFNEKFDGIVYAVFVSLGFAMVENMMYVFQGGIQTGILRAVTAVPFHALVGVSMGFYFGLAKFQPEKRKGLLLKAFLFPFFFHGLYDYCIMSNRPLFLLLWLPLLVYLYINAFKKLKKLSVPMS